jgi:hypothetical protein
MPARHVGRMLHAKERRPQMPTWMHFVDWGSMTAMMILWLALTAVIGYAAALLAWRERDRHRPPSSPTP